MKIYIITQGEYSDYGIRAVFTIPEKAQRYKQKHGGNIEEYDSDLDDPDKNKRIFYVEMKKDGDVIDSGEFLGEEFDDHNHEYSLNWFFYILPDEEKSVQEKTPQELYEGIKFGGFKVFLESDSEKRAIKVVGELRAKLLASGLWGRNEKGEPIMNVCDNAIKWR